MGLKPTNCTAEMIVLVAILLANLFSSVATKTVPQSRYGGPIKRPPFGSFSRPSNPFPGPLIPSPSHAYSILARPPQQPPQQQQRPMRPFVQQPNQGIQFQPPRPQIQQYNPTFANNFQQPQPQQHHHQVQAVAQQTVYYPQVNFQQQQPQQQQQQQNFYKPLQPQQSVSYYQPQQQNNNLISTSSSSNMMSYVPQASSRPVHFHPNKQQLDASGSSSINTYEPCTNSHWQPIVSASSSVVPVQTNMAASGSSATWSRPSGPTYFRYQPESSNKVVVLSHDVLKTLLANSKGNQVSSKPEIGGGIKGIVDNVATAASSASATIVTSNGNSLDKGSDQPSVKLVGYIGPTSDNTPTGYIQVPVGKQELENLSGSNLGSYDFAVNSSQYSLFTMKSVNDVQSLLGVIKSSPSSSSSVVADQDTSASQNIPLGLVVSTDSKGTVSSSSASDPIFYPSSSSSSSQSGGSNPSIQMVGHVQVTSPDVSSQFTKREGKSEGSSESEPQIVTAADSETPKQ